MQLPATQETEADDRPLRVVEFGVRAREQLRRTVHRAKADDPLAPVTVVMPSAHAGVTLRRALAAADGLVNVQFISFPQLAELLAAPLLATELRAPLAGAVQLAAIRASLEEAPGWLGGVAANGTTAQSLASTFGEMRDLPAGALDRLATVEPRGAEVVRLYRDVRDRCVGFADARDVLATAVTAVRTEASSLAAVGQVVVFLPRQLGHLEIELIAALGRRNLVTVLLGSSEAAATTADGAGRDEPALERQITRLEPSLGPAARSGDADASEADTDAAARAGRRAVVRAPDPDEEVRAAVRRVLGALEAGIHPDRIALVARLADPYFALAHEQLTAAGIPHHGPSGLRLHQTVAGRTLLGGLDLLRDGLPRVDLLRWLRAGPFTQPDGWPLPVDSFERIAREAGIAGGREQWSERLAEAITEIDGRVAALLASDPPPEPLPGNDEAATERADAPGPASFEVLDAAASASDAADAAAVERAEGPTGRTESAPAMTPARWQARRLGKRAQHLRTLIDVIDWLGAMADELATASSWRAQADWARRFLDALLGPVDRFQPNPPDIDPRWLEREAQAYQRVLDTLDSLRGLDEIHERSTSEAFCDVLQAELEQPAMPVGVFGHGVFIGGVAEVVGADHDLVIVLGMAEGVYPPRGQDDPILPDQLRGELGREVMAPRRTPRADERRDHLAAMASGREVVMSFARTDTRAHRERLPSRWLLAEVHRLLGRDDSKLVTADELDELVELDDAAWWTDIPSFAWTVEHAASGGADIPLVNRSEVTAVEMFRDRRLARRPTSGENESRTRGDEARIVVPSDRPELMRGVTAGVERHAGRFGPHTGLIGPDPALVFDEMRVGSATSFETWAVCPFRYFVRYVLDVRGLDERADSDEINALDRGSYMHKVLEEFVGERIDDTDGLVTPRFPRDELERLRETARSVGEEFRAEGRTGRPLLWSLRSEQLLRRLEQIFDDDLAHRDAQNVQPIAVELAFGGAGGWEGPDGEREAAVPPVVVTLNDGRPLAFRGFVDRVDRSPDGDRLIVIDYKTGSDRGYDELNPRNETIDIVCRGRHLQLALYALAAQEAFGDVPVTAFFWFVEKPARYAFRGGDIDQFATDRLQEVLGVVVEGIEHGLFPARPGDDGYFGFTNCGFCDFNRICPVSRGDLWETVRTSPELAPYRDLAEGELRGSTPKDDGP